MPLVTALTIERPEVVPIGELCRSPLRIGRVRQFREDPLQVGLGFTAIAGERPALGEAGEIFTPIMLAEPGKCALAERQRRLEISRRARRQITRPGRIALIARRR